MKRSYIKDEKGKTVAIRETTDRGDRSYTYEYKNRIFMDKRGKCIDVTDHHEDGTSTSYEYDSSLIADVIFNDPRGKKK